MVGPASDAEPESNLAADTLAGDGVASGGIVPGSYLPPSTVHRPAVAPSSEPAWPSGPPPLPAEWAPRAASSSSSTSEPAPWAPTPGAVGASSLPAVAPVAAAPAAPAAIDTAAEPGRRQLVPGRASILADLPFDAPDEIEGWLVALGAGVSTLAFFLPWRDSLGEGLDGYFGSWGLGIAAHLPMFVLVVVVLALAVLPNRVAAWVRTGVLGMVVGGILFGLVWLYLEGGASQLGALLGAVGAVLMIGGGVIAVAPGRAKRPDTDA
ncbi:MAG TPA: hypothetical protein VFO50_03360 [Candidatus Limnocylindrales bacterium]|nr:hypothetical protein [Candidatus Limnocylindrales bacterium]